MAQSQDSWKHNRKIMLKKALTSIGENWTLVHLLQNLNLETREKVQSVMYKPGELS